MDSKQEQVLAIKVMRLSRPSLMFNDQVKLDPWDLAGQLDKSTLSSEIQDGNEISPVGSALLLPQAFGTIYLGETFQSYLRVQNTGSQLVSNVIVKADLQTAGQRLQLTKKSNSATQLEPQQSVDEILYHEVTEIGTHILVCEVSYQIGSGESLTSSRYYKFQVLKPLDVKTKFYNAEAPSYGDLRLTIEDLPNPVKLHQPINLTCRITNTSERPVELSLVLETRSKPTGALLWTGTSNRPLEKLDPNQSTEIKLNLVSVLPGLQSISGLKLVDLFLKRTYDYPDLAQILVLP